MGKKKQKINGAICHCIRSHYPDIKFPINVNSTESISRIVHDIHLNKSTRFNAFNLGTDAFDCYKTRNYLVE